MPKPTYYERVYAQLTTPKTIPDLIDELGLPSGKQIYVIDGIKKGITLGTIEKISTSGEKRLWLGHWFVQRS